MIARLLLFVWSHETKSMLSFRLAEGLHKLPQGGVHNDELVYK